MALPINLYTFAKKPNSTKIPTSGAVPANIELKAPTDIINPSFTLSGVPTPYIFNYCYIPEFERYYFIDNWHWELGVWRAECHVDVLASFKTEIGNSYQYVLRSASAFDGMITDTLYPLTRDFDFDSTAVETGRPLTISLSQGFYMIGVISKTGSVGAVNYYLLNSTQFNALKVALFNDTQYGVSDVSAQMLATMFNPFDYIVSCKWVPFTNAYNYFSTTAVTSISVGWWTFNCSAYLINGQINIVRWQFNLPASVFGTHPQATRGEYLNGKPYTEYNLLIVPYGIINLPNDCQLHGCGCEETVDVVTGESILTISVYNSDDGYFAPLISVKSQMFVDIQLAQVRSDGGWVNTANKTAEKIGALASKFGDNSVTRKISNIMDVVRSDTETVTRNGLNGSIASLAEFTPTDAIVTKISQYIADEDNPHFGRPLSQHRLLSTLSGYTLCAEAEVEITGTQPEADKIITYLNTGFFME